MAIAEVSETKATLLEPIQVDTELEAVTGRMLPKKFSQVSFGNQEARCLLSAYGLTVFPLAAESGGMLVDEEFVIEEEDIEEQELGGDKAGVHMRYNQTDPDVIRDGIDSVAVIEEPEDVYRVDYWGYVFGRLRVTAAGVEQLGRDLLGNPDNVPSWTLNPKTVDADDMPWWIPDQTPVAPTVSCDVCEEKVSVRNVVTPQRPVLTFDAEVFCRDCWDAHR